LEKLGTAGCPKKEDAELLLDGKTPNSSAKQNACGGALESLTKCDHILLASNSRSMTEIVGTYIFKTFFCYCLVLGNYINNGADSIPKTLGVGQSFRRYPQRPVEPDEHFHHATVNMCRAKYIRFGWLDRESRDSPVNELTVSTLRYAVTMARI
jgi:hypothetical protein